MTRRDQIHKWFVYALALVPVWLLDEFVLNRVPTSAWSPCCCR